MSRDALYRQRGVGLALILGPALFLAAALTFVLGIGATPDGVGRVTEGVIGYFGVICFLVVFLELARRLGQTLPAFGLVCATTGLLGAAGAVLAYGARIFYGFTVAAGVDAVIYQAVHEAMIPDLAAVAITAPLFPLTSILLGIGLLRTYSMARRAAFLLILAGLCFAGAHMTETAFGLTVLYPLSGILWLAALAPVGWPMLSGGASDG